MFAARGMIEPSYLRATRAGYDAVAAEYADWVRDDLTAKPLDRALLGVFAELVHADGAPAWTRVECIRCRPVARHGCRGSTDLPGPAVR